MDETVIIGAEAWIPKHLVHIDRIRSDLFIENKATTRKEELGLKLTKGDYEGVNLYREEGNHVAVPRGYPIPWKYGVEFPAGTRYMSPEPEYADFPKFRLELKTWQEPAAKALWDARGQDKTLCLGCGKGKTILALHYAGKCGLRTLIIVDRDFLLDQWIRAVKKCFWIPRDEIAIVQGNKKWFSADFTVAMLHTLARRLDDVRFHDEWWDQFGLIIMDETHVAAAPTFRPVIPKLPGERLGLSATLNRRDGMDPVFRYHMGGMTPCYTNLDRFQPATWIIRRVPRCITDKALKKKCTSWVPNLGRRMLNRAMLDSQLAREDIGEPWDHLIVSDVTAAALAGRCCIVLGTRIEQLRRLHEKLVEKGVYAGFVHSDVKGILRAAEFKKQVIISTTSLASRALDVEELDTLFLLYPSVDDGFLRQALGRIDRPLDDKYKPMIVVYSHYYIDELAKKERQMRETIQEIDPHGKVEVVQP